MATNYYSLPTINGTDTIDCVNAINGLATATDTTLHNIAGDIGDVATLDAKVTNLTTTLNETTTTANTAYTTANQASSLATTANSTANTALNKANTALAAFESTPVSVLTSYVSTYVLDPSKFSVTSWGHVVQIRITGGITLNTTSLVTVGQINSKYAPNNDVLFSYNQYVNSENPAIPWFMRVTTTGEIQIHCMDMGTLSTFDPECNAIYLEYIDNTE